MKKNECAYRYNKTHAPCIALHPPSAVVCRVVKLACAGGYDGLGVELQQTWTEFEVDVLCWDMFTGQDAGRHEKGKSNHHDDPAHGRVS